MVARSADLDFEIRGFSYPSQATVATTPPRCRGYAARTSIRDSSSERLRGRRPFNHREFTVLATILDRTRKRLPFALCGYCFILDPIHAIIFPEETTTISNVMKSFKLATFQSLRRSGDRPTAFWLGSVCGFDWDSAFACAPLIVDLTSTAQGIRIDSEIGLGRHAMKDSAARTIEIVGNLLWRAIASVVAVEQIIPDPRLEVWTGADPLGRSRQETERVHDAVD